jgi:hypothetical protein
MLLGATSVWGAPVTFFGLDDPRGVFTNSNGAFNSFVATLSSYGVDDIESYAAFATDPTLSFGTTGITAATNVNNVAEFAPLAVSGTKSLVDQGPASATGAPFNDTFTFNQAITAFGLYITNGGDATTANTVSLLLENTLLNTSKSVSIGTLGPGASFSNTLFFGVTDLEPFNRVTLVETFDFDGLLLDNITAGFVVIPETSSWLMAAIVTGAAGLAGFYRQRTRRA